MGELPSCEGRDQETNAELLPSDTLLRSLGGNGLSTGHNKNLNLDLQRQLSMRVLSIMYSWQDHQQKLI